MKKIKLCVALMLSVSLIYAQDHSVDPKTGTLSVGLPLFTITDGDLSVSGILAYGATGVKVTDDGGWVGQNWSLSVQGFGITREMRGLPDDYFGTSPDNRRGWLRSTTSLSTNIKNFVLSTDNNPATCADEVSNYTFLNGIGYAQDTEPDVFNVNAPGLSFQFYFDENKVPQVVPFQDVIVSPNTVTGTITSFIVTDARGVQYKFEDLETITQSTKAANLYYLARRSNLHLTPFTCHTGWKLTKIISPIYGTIDFTYRQVTSIDNNISPKKNKLEYLYPVKFTNSTLADGKLEYNRTLTFKIPLKISSPSMEVQFLSSSNDGTVVGLLNTVNVYDKREGALKLVKIYSLQYSTSNSRSFLEVLAQQGGQQVLPSEFFNFEYYLGTIPLNPPSPPYSSTEKDDWGFYKMNPASANYMLYNETVSRGMLRKIIYPQKGYSVFFYEAHDYWNGTTTLQGGGLRVRKIVSFDGVSTTGDIVKEYDYKNLSGQSSGKIQHLPASSISGVRVDNYLEILGARYRNILLANPGIATSLLNSYFTVKASDEISNSELLNGSAIAYERVVEKTLDGGHSVYEYDLPASYGETSANSNEWEASKVSIARPSSGSSYCYETGPVVEGINQYPYPPHPNYNFAKGLLKKITDFREDGFKRREVTYEYNRVYGGTGIKKIYGLAFEELPTYYHNGSVYVDSKMFVFSRYAINTDVKTVIKKQTEVLYTSNDLTKKVETSTEYFYDAVNHRELSRIVQLNSDQSQKTTRLKYVRDYPITTPADAQATALNNLVTIHGTGALVESTTTRTVSGVEKYISADLNYFQTLSGKVYPHKQYSFVSNDGITSFSPSSTSGTVFTFDQTNYVLTNTFLSFDSYGKPKEIVGRDKNVNTAVNGFFGSAPVIQASNAKAIEFLYSDFEAITEVSFTTPWNPALTEGRQGSKGVLLPTGTGGPYYLVKGVTNTASQNYVFSCWLKPSVAGTISVKLTGNISATTTLPYVASSTWKYYAVNVPIPATMTSTSFSVEVKTSAAVQIDDVAFCPSQASFIASTYSFPFGPAFQTDSQGNTSYIAYDERGRVKLVQDRDGNIVKKYDYQTKP